MSFNWYVIHTKPKQEQRALLNLEQQGYKCYLPWLKVNKLKRGKLIQIDEVMFSRYLFIRLCQDQWAKSWHPIRSTLGVSTLLMLGNHPQKVDEAVINSIHIISLQETVRKLFNEGDQVIIREGALKGMEGIYQIENGKDRAMILIGLLGKAISLQIPIYYLARK
ncbi:NusG Transcription antiterminator [Candidatus Methylopumilus universalis]|uniref:transcription/translation regulatory transformer protein RfaH n=1 Tax=Candidatus Methylopumilus universalis TaxID=2588536 RepID=UPI003BEEC094